MQDVATLCWQGVVPKVQNRVFFPADQLARSLFVVSPRPFPVDLLASPKQAAADPWGNFIHLY